MTRRPLLLTSTLCACLLLGISSARADDAARQKQVEQLFTVMHLEQTFDQLMNQVMAQNQSVAASLFPELEADPKQKAEYDAFMTRLATVIQSSFSWSAFEPEYAKIYLRTYSDEELSGMLAFYDSPVGRSVLAKTPQVLQASSAIAVERMQELSPRLRAMIDEEVEKLKSRQASSGK